MTGTKFTESVGRRATEAIKAHEMQMALYVGDWWAELRLHLLAITSGGRKSGSR